MAIQFGYLTMFASVAPWAACVCMLVNEARRMLHLHGASHAARAWRVACCTRMARRMLHGRMLHMNGVPRAALRGLDAHRATRCNSLT